MRNTVKETQDTPAKIPSSFVFVILGINLLAGLLALLRLTALPEAVLLIISYLCQLLTLTAQFIGIGAALFCLARGQKKSSFLYLLLAVGGLLLALLIAGIAESFLYLDVATVLLTQISSAFLNSLLYFAFYGVCLILVHFLFFRRTAEQDITPPPFFGRHSITAASLLICGGLFLAKLAFQIVETVTFVDQYWPSIYTNEIVSLVLDYVFLLASAVAGHFAACGAAIWLATEESDEE